MATNSTTPLSGSTKRHYQLTSIVSQEQAIQVIATPVGSGKDVGYFFPIGNPEGLAKILV